MGASTDPPDATTVLHADRYPAFTELSAEFLERAAPCLTVERAETVDEALEVLRAGGVDCVVSGYALPPTDGLDLLDRVRAADPGLPFVLFTGCREPALRRAAVRRGATAVLRKETDPEQFAALADRIVAMAARTRRRPAPAPTADGVASTDNPP